MNEDTQEHRTGPSRRLSLAVGISAVAVLTVWTFTTPPGVMGKAVAIAYAICHRIAERSFLIDGVPMPLCARCTGIYLGVMTSFLLSVINGRTRVRGLPPLRVMAALVGFVLLMGIDGINSYLKLFPGYVGIYEPHNVLRLITGMYCGVAMFHITLPIFNGAVWQEPDPGRSLNDLRDLAGVCAAAAVVILLVLSERPVFLWVLGVLSVLGVVLILTMVGTVLFLTFTRLTSLATSWRQLAIPLLAGLTFGFIQIGAISIVRFALTGTWDGFVISAIR